MKCIFRHLFMIASFLLCVLLLPCANAEAVEIVDSGTCGTNTTWTLDNEGLLTISGTGSMTSSPWRSSHSTDIKAVIIDNGVTTIGGSYSFSDCSELKTVTIPESVTFIGDWSFVGCSSLTSFSVEESNTVFSSVDGVLYNKSHTKLIRYPCARSGDYVILNEVTIIEHGAFSGCAGLTDVTIPDSVEEIGVDAFTNCAFTEITLPTNLETLSLEAFNNCKQLTTVAISAGIKTIGRSAFSRTQLSDVWFSGTIDEWNRINMDSWNGVLTHATIHCSDGIATEGKNVRLKGEALPYDADITLSSYTVHTPALGQEPVTIQAEAKVFDQYGDPIVPQTLTWSLYESRSDSGGPYLTLNGITIDEITGVITVSSNTKAGSVYVKVYAFSRITSDDGSNTTGGGSAGWTTITIHSDNLPAVSASPVSGNCEYTETDDCYSAEVSLSNTSNKTVIASLFLAEYDKNGKMLNVAENTVEIAANGTSTANLNTESKTADMLSLFVLDENGVPLTENCRAKTLGIGAKAWYEVENGSLYIRTNIDSSEWENGYSGTIRCSFSDGSRDFDNQGGHGDSVSFSVLTLPFQNAGTTVRQIDYVVYDTSSFAYQQFWPQFVELGDYDAFDTAVDACSDHVVARFTLYTPLLVTSSDKTLTLQSFEISYNNTNQTETYTAVLDEPLSDEGEYSVHYRSSSGNQYAGMSAIFKSGNVLTFTRNIHHFADTGSSGFFKIVHAECKKQENGSIICEKAESNWYPYTFE